MSYFAGVMVAYVETRNKSITTTITKGSGIINDYSNAVRYKSSVQKSITFLYVSNEQVEFEIQNKISLVVALKEIK